MSQSQTNRLADLAARVAALEARRVQTPTLQLAEDAIGNGNMHYRRRIARGDFAPINGQVKIAGLLEFVCDGQAVTILEGELIT